MIQIRCVVENNPLPDTDFRAEHGVAFHIQTPAGQVLFDTGESGDVLLHNARLLDIDLGAVDAIAISHAHNDHTWGLPHVLPLIRPNVPLYANADLFRPRYSGDDRKSVGIAMPREELAAAVHLRLSDEPTEMIPGVWTTGAITDRPY
ncbi:MAG: MBL fold metallo-hydrolase, partial [Chloroflexi bacterium]|nr:MBL fold metallo-hydrolase [Chloroflexota bacterium]